MSNSSIWPIDRTLLGATTPGQSEPGNDSNEGVLCIPQSSSITEITPSDCFVSFPGHSLEKGRERERDSRDSIQSAGFDDTIYIKTMFLNDRSAQILASGAV